MLGGGYAGSSNVLRLVLMTVLGGILEVLPEPGSLALLEIL